MATAHTIAENLEKRMQSFKQTKVFLAAVWVDSRSRILLNSDQKEKAKLELFSVYKRLKKSITMTNHRSVLMKMLMSITEKLQSLKAISTRLLEPPSKVQIRHLKYSMKPDLKKSKS